MATRAVADRDAFSMWLQDTRQPRRGSAGRVGPVRGGLRFAFYGRTSTAEYQDRESSLGWQREVAEDLIAPHGAIAAAFFDHGCPRRLSWPERPQAAGLLAELGAPARRFDAVVVGEYERAFANDDQFEGLVRLCERHGVRVWLPEANGPVDLEDATHRALMLLLGAQSGREVARSRHRTLGAMRAQACGQGRYLGGRPPYGYRLVDAGPHPNRAHARWGRQRHCLQLDPATAPHVQWIFAQRLAGHSVASIARGLNEWGVPCPSQADPERNRHRSGALWSVNTVAVILANPRYTGRQVWNRRRSEHQPREPGMRKRRGATRPNPGQQWAVSERPGHPALVSEQDFLAVQSIRAARRSKDGSTRHYVLASLLRCRLCQRRMEAHWANGRAGYRCRHGHSSARQRDSSQPANLYLREDRLLAALPSQLATYDTVAALQGVDSAEPDALAEVMRGNSLVLVCDRTTWTVEPDDAPSRERDESPGQAPVMG